MNPDNQPIGVFDSGAGGLTVLRQLQACLPHESFVYLGDTARLPFGTKSPAMVAQATLDAAAMLVAASVKLLVVACNTATMAALDLLRQRYPQIPVVGMIAPGAKAAAAATQNGNVLVLATEATIDSGCYPQAMRCCDTTVKVTQGACGLWVSLAEEGMLDHPLAAMAVTTYLERHIRAEHDVLLLGCTHFPIFKPLLQALLPPSVAVVDSAIEAAQAVQQTLAGLGRLRHCELPPPPPTQFWVTDLPRRFRRIAPYFLGEAIDEDRIHTVDPSTAVNTLSNVIA